MSSAISGRDLTLSEPSAGASGAAGGVGRREGIRAVGIVSQLRPASSAKLPHSIQCRSGHRVAFLWLLLASYGFECDYVVQRSLCLTNQVEMLHKKCSDVCTC